MEKEHYRSLVAVYAMIVNEANEILLLRRANTGYRDGYDEWIGDPSIGRLYREVV